MPDDGTTVTSGASDRVVARPVAREAPARPAPARAAPPSPETPPPEPRQNHRRLRWILFALLPIVLLGAAYWYVTGGQVMTTDDAYVNADKVSVTTDVSGLVAEIDVADNQHVTRGQVLYRLNPLPFQLALDRANAALGETADQLNAMQANYRDMLTRIQQAKDDLDYAQTQFDRQQTLVTTHAVAQQTVDQARVNLQNAQQSLASLRQQLAGIAFNLNGDPDGPVQQNPRYKTALAQRDEAARELRDSVVRAPFAGTVTDVPAIAPGSYLQASATAFYLVDTDHVWVDATPKETELTWVRPGQRATITVDAYPGLAWHGTVESVSPAAAQEFALLPAENTSGNWVKVVQRVPMRVRVDTSPNDQPPLRAGMSVEVAVDTGHARGLPTFLKGSRFVAAAPPAAPAQP